MAIQSDPVCKNCDGSEKNQRTVGLMILKGFKRDGDEWDGGTILDPRSGEVYSSELRLNDDGKKLLVRVISVSRFSAGQSPGCAAE